MRHSSVGNKRTLDSELDRTGCKSHLGNHASCNGFIINQSLDLLAGETRNELLGLVQDTGNVRQEQDALGLEFAGNTTSGHIGIAIVGNLLFVAHASSNRRNDGANTSIQQLVEQVRVDSFHLANVAKI